MFHVFSAVLFDNHGIRLDVALDAVVDAVVAAVVTPALLLGPLGLEVLDGVARQLLARQQLPHVLLPRLAVANGNDQAGGDVAGDTDAQDDGGDGERAVVVVDAPGGGTQRDLQTRVAVEQDDNGNQVAQRKGKVRKGLVGLVEAVGLGQLLLVVAQALPLLVGQRRVLVVLDVQLGGLDVAVLVHHGLLGVGRGHGCETTGAGGDSVSLSRCAGTLGTQALGVVSERIAGRAVVELDAVAADALDDAGLLVLELLLLGLFNLARVVYDKGHVVRIDGAEGGQAVAHDGEQGHQHAVDDVDGVDLLVAHVDPADEEQHPGQAEEGDERGVERHEEAQRPPHVLAEALHHALELGPARVQHVAHAVVQLQLLLLGPALETEAVGQRGIVRVCEPRRDGIRSSQRHGRALGGGGLDAGLARRQLLRLLWQAFLLALGSAAQARNRPNLTLRQHIRGTTVDPRAEIRHEQRVLHVGQSRKSLDLGI